MAIDICLPDKGAVLPFKRWSFLAPKRGLTISSSGRDPPPVTFIHAKVRINGRAIKRVKGVKKRQSPLEAILKDYSISKEKCNPVNIWASPPSEEKRCSPPNGSECLIRANVWSHYHLTALLMSGSKALAWHQTCSIKLWQLVKSWGSRPKRRWRQCETGAHLFFIFHLFLSFV